MEPFEHYGETIQFAHFIVFPEVIREQNEVHSIARRLEHVPEGPAHQAHPGESPLHLSDCRGDEQTHHAREVRGSRYAVRLRQIICEEVPAPRLRPAAASSG